MNKEFKESLKKIEKELGIDEVPYKKKELDKKVILVFKGNRRFELYIGKKLLVFNPKEAKEVDAKIVEHTDFKRQENYFVVKEVK